MADLKRVFSQRSAETGQLEWLFLAREGLEGPFEDEHAAQQALDRYIQFCLFDLNRVFLQRNQETDQLEWFFVARNSIEGPYISEQSAQSALQDYIENNKQAAG